MEVKTRKEIVDGGKPRFEATLVMCDEIMARLMLACLEHVYPQDKEGYIAIAVPAAVDSGSTSEFALPKRRISAEVEIVEVPTTITRGAAVYRNQMVARGVRLRFTTNDEEEFKVALQVVSQDAGRTERWFGGLMNFLPDVIAAARSKADATLEDHTEGLRDIESRLRTKYLDMKTLVRHTTVRMRLHLPRDSHDYESPVPDVYEREKETDFGDALHTLDVAVVQLAMRFRETQADIPQIHATLEANEGMWEAAAKQTRAFSKQLNALQDNQVVLWGFMQRYVIWFQLPWYIRLFKPFKPSLPAGLDKSGQDKV